MRPGNPRKLKWTKAFRKAAGKEMTVDTTLTFAARRHVPMRYSRDAVVKTLDAMRRVEEIRRRRERRFYKQRMAGNAERERAANRKLVIENQHLLPKEMRDPVVEAAEEMEPTPAEMSVDEVSEEEELVKMPVKIAKKKARANGMEVN